MSCVFINLNLDAVSEKAWKWQYKLRHIGKSGEKTLSDFSSGGSDDGSLNKKKAHKKNKGRATLSTSTGTAPNGSNNNKNGEIGANVSIKTFYEGPNSREDIHDWVDYPPKQLSKSAARAQDRVAIKVFKVKDLTKPIISGRFSLRYHMVQVQNPLLVGALSEILKKQDVHIDASDIATFKHPFQDLYFGYDDMVAKHRKLDETDPASPLRPFLLLFIRLLDDIFSETRAKIKALLAEGLISYKLAWTLFPKNTTVMTWGNNCELLCKVTDTAYHCINGLEFLTVQGQVLRFDGRGFQWEDYAVKFRPFSGHRPIMELTAYPVEFHKSAEEVRARLTARGRKVLDYQGLTYANYCGIAMHQDGKATQKHNVDSRVLIDVVGYNKHHLAQGSREGSDPQTKKRQVVVSENADDDQGDTATSTADAAGGGGPSTVSASAAAGVKRLSPTAQERNKQAMLAKEADEAHLMFMLPLIEGYALKNKLWVSFFVEDIRPMIWNDEAYEHLVYDEQQKDLVMSFVESHCGGGDHGEQKQPRAMQDVIAGKGQGLVMLLSGPPGTGKTLMAEAVADRTRRPLFYLQAEDLGIGAAVLGANIKKVFEMATEWDAVILLDEADVFMAERHPQDIARNELVSIFLRELEYFQGIIFLTTNLYSTIDSAFRSRVSLHLLFNALTPEARTLIWRKFLNRLPRFRRQIEPSPSSPPEEGHPEEENTSEETLTDEDVKELGAWQLNGREIKTAVKMTRTWCDHKGYPMTLARIENGIKVTSPHATKSSQDHDTSLYDE